MIKKKIEIPNFLYGDCKRLTLDDETWKDVCYVDGLDCSGKLEYCRQVSHQNRLTESSSAIFAYSSGRTIVRDN